MNGDFRNAQNVFAIKKFDVAKMVDIIMKIADSFNMLQLSEM